MGHMTISFFLFIVAVVLFVVYALMGTDVLGPSEHSQLVLGLGLAVGFAGFWPWTR